MWRNNVANKAPVTDVRLSLDTPCSASYIQQSGIPFSDDDDHKSIYQEHDFASIFPDTTADPNVGARQINSEGKSNAELYQDILGAYDTYVQSRCSFDFNANQYQSSEYSGPYAQPLTMKNIFDEAQLWDVQ